MSTGELEGLHSSGKGLGMDGMEEEKDSLFTLEEVKIKKNTTRSETAKITSAENDKLSYHSTNYMPLKEKVRFSIFIIVSKTQTYNELSHISSSSVHRAPLLY